MGGLLEFTNIQYPVSNFSSFYWIFAKTGRNIYEQNNLVDFTNQPYVTPRKTSQFAPIVGFVFGVPSMFLAWINVGIPNLVHRLAMASMMSYSKMLATWHDRLSWFALWCPCCCLL